MSGVEIGTVCWRSTGCWQVATRDSKRHC